MRPLCPARGCPKLLIALGNFRVALSLAHGGVDFVAIITLVSLLGIIKGDARSYDRTSVLTYHCVECLGISSRAASVAST